MGRASDFPQPIQTVGKGSWKIFRCSGVEEPAKNCDISSLANHIEMCHFVRRLHSVAIRLHPNGVLKKISFLKKCIGTKNKRKTVNGNARRRVSGNFLATETLTFYSLLGT